MGQVAVDLAAFPPPAVGGEVFELGDPCRSGVGVAGGVIDRAGCVAASNGGQLGELLLGLVEGGSGNIGLFRRCRRPSGAGGLREEPVAGVAEGDNHSPVPLDRHLRRFTEPGDDAYLFTSAAGVPIEASNFRSRVWLPATRRAGLTGLRFHDLRHSAGTLAAQTCATTKELMARLGHASSQAAMVYQHASLARDVVIAERLAQMAEGAGLVPASDASVQTGADRNGQ